MSRNDHRFFPHPSTANADGLVVTTPTMTADIVLAAYREGLFPWSSDPVRWYSPDPRAVFVPEHLRLPKRLGKVVRRHGFRVTFDAAFQAVMEGCDDAHVHEGQWITPLFHQVYGELHRQGYAHSVEVWQGDELVGGLYGVQVGRLFAGESMFYRVDNASKVAFAALVGQWERLGISLADAQVINAHTHRLGAVLVTREDYLWLLDRAVQDPTAPGPEKWVTPVDPLAFLAHRDNKVPSQDS